MKVLMGISSLMGLVSVIAVIWLAGGAFRRGRTGWGLGILFGPLIPTLLYLGYFWVIGPSRYHLYLIPAIALVTPATIIFYARRFWDDVKKPSMVYMSSTVLSLGLGFYVFSASGGMAMLKASQDVARGIAQGNLTEQDALKFMNKNLDMMESSDLSPQQQKKMAFMREFLKKAEGGFTEEERNKVQSDFQRLNNPAAPAPPTSKAPQSIPAKKEKTDSRQAAMKPTPVVQTSEAVPQAPAPLPDTEPVPEKTMILISHDGGSDASVGSEQLAQMKGWLRKFVRVTPKNGVPQRGVLVDVSPKALRLEKDMSAGFVSLPFNYDEIESIELVE